MHEYRIQIILAVLLVFLLYKLLRSVLKKKLDTHQWNMLRIQDWSRLKSN